MILPSALFLAFLATGPALAGPTPPQKPDGMEKPPPTLVPNPGVRLWPQHLC